MPGYFHRGQVLTAKDLNELMRQVRSVRSYTDMVGGSTPAGTALSALVPQENLSEVAHLALAENIDPTVDIEPYGALQVSWPGGGYSGLPLTDHFGPRIMQVRRPSVSCFGRFVVAAEKIPRGEVGHIWVPGVCLVQIDTPPTSNIDGLPAGSWDCDRADTQADSFKLKPVAMGAAQILWADAATGYAVVKMQTRMTSGTAIRDEGSGNQGIVEVMVFDSTDGTANITITQVEVGVVQIDVA